MDFGTYESLCKVILSAIKISGDTSGLRCNRVQALASDFLTKNLLVSFSIWNIANPKKTLGVMDFPSAYVLVRSLFEGYLNMNYLLIDPQSDAERDFRLDLWDRHALLERQKMGSSLGSKNKKLQTEKQQIESYTKSLEASPYFRNLSKKEQQSYLKKWTKLDTIERADRAYLHKSQSQFIYKFLSNYAHSESYAMMQIHDVRSPETAQELMRVPILLTEMFLSLTLKLFGQLQPIAQSLIERDKELLEIMKYWDDYKTKDLKLILADRGTITGV